MLTDEEADAIRLGLAAGMRGPVLIKWVGLLLADRMSVSLEPRTGRHLWPGPLSGPEIEAHDH